MYADDVCACQDAFDEVPLFRGRIKDYKRRTAGCVGILKCKIKIFRKEDETLAGKAKADVCWRMLTYAGVC